jgi:glucan biosynthesis protein C
MSNKTALSQRRYDLDWLRVFAILVVFIFHSGRFFDQWPWHVKSATVYAPVQAWSVFLCTWMMPLFFIISGASLFYTVGEKGVVSFIRDKILRLLVPFVVGIFTHVSFAVYLERYTQGQFIGSFLEFYPHYFNGMYGFGGNFAWFGLHLWYLLILFIFTLLLLPLFYLLKGPGRNFLDKLGNILAVPGVILILILLVLVLLSDILDPRTLLGQRNFGGWPLPIYICYLFFGFIIFSHARLRVNIQKIRWFYLFAALVTAGVFFWQFAYAIPFPDGTREQQAIFGRLYNLSSPLFILAFIGFAGKYLTNNTPFLRYTNEAVLPFYIMHQTVLLTIGYFVLQWQMPDLLKWIIITLSSFLAIAALYEFLVRRFNVLRFLFGMKLLTKQRNRIKKIGLTEA